MNIALQKTIQSESLILGNLEEKIKEYLETKYANIPYEYALLNETNENLINNSSVHLNNDLVVELEGRVFTSLKESNFIKLLFYHFNDYFGTTVVRGDIEYCANYEFMKDLKQKVVNEIIQKSNLESFVASITYFKEKCSKHNTLNAYEDVLKFSKKYFLKKEEESINKTIKDELEPVRVAKEEEKNRLETLEKEKLLKEQKKEQIKAYTKQIEKKKAKIKQLEKEIDQEV